MSIQQGQNIEASDFINESEKDATPANDEGRVPKLENTGKVSRRFLDLQVETTTGTTHSLTTDGVESVLVIATGTVSSPGGSTATANLLYDGVTKNSMTGSGDGVAAGVRFPFTLMYFETPAAGTRDITITGSSGQETITVIRF